MPHRCVPAGSSAPEDSSPPPPLQSEALDRGHWWHPGCLCLEVLLPNCTARSSWPVSPPCSCTPSQGFHGSSSSASSDSCPSLTPPVYFRFPFRTMAPTPTWRVTKLISSLCRVPSCHSSDWGAPTPHHTTASWPTPSKPSRSRGASADSQWGTQPQGFRHHDYSLYSPVLVYQPSDFQTD